MAQAPFDDLDRSRMFVGAENNPGKRKLDNNAVRRFVLTHINGPRGAALLDAEAVRIMTVQTAAPDRRTGRPISNVNPMTFFQQTWNNALHLHQNGMPDIVSMLRKTGHLGTKKNATLILFAPDAGFLSDAAGMGMPRDEAEIYLQSHMQSTLAAGLRLHFKNALPDRFRLRIEFMYTTADAGDVEMVTKMVNGVPVVVNRFVPAGPPMALLGPTPIEVPRLYFDDQRIVTTAPHGGNLDDQLEQCIEGFVTWITDSMPRQTSNRILDTLVAAYIWAVPTNQAGMGGALYGMARLSATQTALSSGIHALLAHSQGLFLNKPDVKDSMCIARAVMMGLDPMASCRLDTHAAIVLKSAMAGAQRWLKEATKEYNKAIERSSVTVQTNKRLLIFSAQAAIKRCFLLEQEVEKTFLALKIPFVSDMDKTRERYSAVEKDLKLALAGKHPLVSFADPFFHTAQPLSQQLIQKLRAAVVKPHQIKFQIWAPGVAGRVGLVYTDKPTLDFVLSGGRVLNLLLGDNHASIIRNVNACMNHTSDEAASAAASAGVSWAKNRITCSLCGHHMSAGNAEAAWRMFEHQERGCVRMEGVKFSPALSPTNLRQLSAFACRALNRPLLIATLATTIVELPAAGEREAQATLGLWSCLKTFDSTGWFFVSKKREWEDMRARFRSTDTAEVALMTQGVRNLAVSAEDFFHFATRGEEDPLRELLTDLCSVPRVNGIMSQLHLKCPKDAALLEALGPVTDTTVCFCCGLLIKGPSKWSLQSARFAATKAEKIDEGELEDEDEEDVETDMEDALDRDAPVVHHCHSTGFVAHAHAWCNTLMTQSSNELVVEVDSNDTMARITEIVCSEAFIETTLKGYTPRLSENEGLLTKIVLKVAGTPYLFDKAEKPKILTLVFRPHAALFSAPEFEFDLAKFSLSQLKHYEDAVPTHKDSSIVRTLALADKLLVLCETEFAETKLWPTRFPTYTAFAKHVLYAMIEDPEGRVPTSIASKESFDNAKRLVTGGRIVLGERVTWPPIDTKDKSVYRGLLDFTAEYPKQLLYPLPWQEHLDRCAFNFSEDLAKGLAFIRDTVETSEIFRLEISGGFAPALHATVGRFCPIQTKKELFGRDLSIFQRVSMGKAVDKSLGVYSVAHLYPIENEVMFLRTAKMLMRLGFEFTSIKTVFATPSKDWARPFAEKMQARRRLCQLKGDAAGADAAKLLANSVIGTLNMDPSKYTSLVGEKMYTDESTGRMTKTEEFNDNPRYTLKTLEAGDLCLYELKKRSWWHKAQTLAFSYIQEMARCDLIELWHGSDEFPGIAALFPSAVLGYGCTDSLCVEFRLTDWGIAQGLTDARHEVFLRLKDRFDLSNVPLTSTFFIRMPDGFKAHALCQREENRGKWGFIKDETGMCGISTLMVNGPNRWAFRVVQSEDTLDKYKGHSDVLKSIPLAWKYEYSFEDFCASWDKADTLPEPLALPPTDKHFVHHVFAPAGVQKRRNALSIWGNSSCIVSRTPPFCQWPIGSQVPEAVQCVEGSRW